SPPAPCRGRAAHDTPPATGVRAIRHRSASAENPPCCPYPFYPTGPSPILSAPRTIPKAPGRYRPESVVFPRPWRRSLSRARSGRGFHVVLDQMLRDLHGVQRRALPQIIRHAPEIQAVFHGRILAHAGDEHIVLAL